MNGCDIAEMAEAAEATRPDRWAMASRARRRFRSTSGRIFWVHEYDGSTGLESAERHPVADIPRMS